MLFAKLWLKRSVLVVGVVATLAGSWAGYLRLSGNFHAIEDGIIYRSGQMSGEQFENRIKDYGIRAIINFRGNNAGKSWYDDEMKASDAAGVQHIDFPLSANREVSDDELTRLEELLRDAPRPLLIHCEGGADRSGFASALYMLVVAKRPGKEAAEQLSFRYGHFPWFTSSTAAMDRTFERILARNSTVSIKQ